MAQNIVHVSDLNEESFGQREQAYTHCPGGSHVSRPCSDEEILDHNLRHVFGEDPKRVSEKKGNFLEVSNFLIDKVEVDVRIINRVIICLEKGSLMGCRTRALSLFVKYFLSHRNFQLK